MRKALVAGNWKMNGDEVANAALVDAIVTGIPEGGRVDLLVCPPFPYLSSVAGQLAGSKLMLGAQTVSEHAGGAFTGEVSAAMLMELGCCYVIVGHSERRALFAETNETVAKKFAAALAAGLTPILCVGETLDDREAGRTETVIDEQLQAVLAQSGVEGIQRAVIAYEPVWAIGTGKTATPDQAEDVHRYIRRRIAVHDAGVAAGVQILYGGSVKGDNAQALFRMPDIDGGLIGGAALKAEDFLSIAGAASRG